MAVVIWLLPVPSFPIARDVPTASLSSAGFGLSIPFASLQRELFVALESVARRGTLCSFFLLYLFGTSCLFIFALLVC